MKMLIDSSRLALFAGIEIHNKPHIGAIQSKTRTLTYFAIIVNIME